MRQAFAVALMMSLYAVAGCVAPDAETAPVEAAGVDLGRTAGGSPAGRAAVSGPGGSAAAGAMGATYGSVSVFLQDAPEDTFSEVHIVVSEVEVHIAGGAAGHDADGAPQDDAADSNETQGGAGNQTEALHPSGDASADGNQTDDAGGNQTGGSAGNQTDDAGGNETDDAGGNDTGAPPQTPPDAVAQDCRGSWISLWNGSADIDLLAHQGDLAAFVGEASLPACKITQIRLHVDEAYGIDHNGTRIDITMPNSVLRIVKSFDVVAGAEQQVVVDIDLNRSLKATGGGPPEGKGNGKAPAKEPSWRLMPVIGKTQITTVDDNESGAEAGGGSQQV